MSNTQKDEAEKKALAKLGAKQDLVKTFEALADIAVKESEELLERQPAILMSTSFALSAAIAVGVFHKVFADWKEKADEDLDQKWKASTRDFDRRWAQLEESVRRFKEEESRLQRAKIEVFKLQAELASKETERRIEEKLKVLSGRDFTPEVDQTKLEKEVLEQLNHFKLPEDAAQNIIQILRRNLRYLKK